MAIVAEIWLRVRRDEVTFLFDEIEPGPTPSS
jgi:hypothetical protein